MHDKVHKLPRCEKTFAKLRRRLGIGRLTDKLDGQNFARVRNLILALKRSPARVQYCDGVYAIDDGELSIRLGAKKRHRRYIRGIRSKLDYIASEYFLDQVEFARNDVFVDCGANIGEIGMWLAAKDEAIEYVAFEPSPQEFLALEQNASFGRLHQLALWNESTRLNFYLSPDDADSSLIEINSSVGEIEVECQRLDEVLADYRRIKVLKIEAEGAEPEVLAGSSGILDRCEYVVVDAGPERGINQEETMPAVINFLLPRGFDILKVSHGRVVCLFRTR